MTAGKRLRIMHVLKSSVYSGAENVVITIIKALSDRFDFLYVASDGPVRQTLERENVPYLLLERFDRRSLKKAVGSYAPDIVHAHDFSASVLSASVEGNFRLISHLHYDPPWVRSWNIRTLAYALCRKRIRRVLTVSQEMFDRMVFSGIYRGIEKKVGNPIDGDRIRRLAAERGQGLEVPACDLLFVGRLVEQKNPERFIRLTDQLRKRGWNELKAFMIGDGPLYDPCRALIENLGLQEQVVMKGFQKNPYPYIANAKILCSTARWEGFGLAAVEANLLGVPVLTTVTAGSLSVFGEGAEELCRTDADYIGKAEQLYGSPEIYLRWKERSVRQAAGWNNLENYMEQMAEIYRNEAAAC